MSTLEAYGRWSSTRRIAANAVTVGALIAGTKIAGALKVAFTARFFGASDDLDAYLIAFALLSFFAEIVAGAFIPAFVPILIRTRSNQGEEAARRLAREGLGFVLGAMVALSAVLAASAGWVLPLLGSSFSAAKLDMTATLFWTLLLWAPLGGCIAAWRAILNAHEVFALPAAASLPTPLAAIAFLYLGAARFGVTVLAVATLVGVAAEVAMLGAAVRRRGYPILPAWSGSSREVTEVRRQYLPTLAGAVIGSGCLLVDQAVAGSMGSGSVSVLAYGTKVAAVLAAIGVTAVATALLPEFSRRVNEEDWPRLRHGIRVSAAAIVLVTIPATAALVWTSEISVRLFFEGGAFDTASTGPVARVQGWALLQVPLAMLAAVAVRMANALSANAVIVRAGVVALAVNIAGDLWLSRAIGVAGIALAGAAAQLVLLGGLAAFLYRREPRLFRSLPARGPA